MKLTNPNSGSIYLNFIPTYYYYNRMTGLFGNRLVKNNILLFVTFKKF